jgi:hypothetical protein
MQQSAPPPSKLGAWTWRVPIAGATLTVEDDRQDYGEDRFITIGFLDATMVVLIWTPRDGAHRVIGMRKANERERTLYGPRF